MPKKQYVIELSQIERVELEGIVRTGQHKARTIRRAQTLLWSDAGKTDTEIAALHGVTPLTVATTRQRWAQERSLEDKPRRGRDKKLDGKQEAFLVALACSDAPGERETWTMQLLADKLVELNVVDDPISDETRRFSNFFPEWEWRVEMRRDSGAFSYGFTVNDRDRFSFFRANEVDTNRNGGPYGTAFVEYRPGPSTAITLDVDNAFNSHFYRERIFYSPNRSSSVADAVEVRERNRHLNFGLTLKQTFGGGAAADKTGDE